MHTCSTPLEHLTAFAVVFSLGLLCAVAVGHCPSPLRLSPVCLRPFPFTFPGVST